jgi:hypothetical protein
MAIMLSTSSVATIEHCTSVAFASSSTSLALPSVQDFTHINTLQHSSNWSVMPDDSQHLIRAHLDDITQQKAASLLQQIRLISAS